MLVLGVSIAEPRFLNAQNLRDILLNVSIVALLAVGQTIVVVTRNIDLSRRLACSASPRSRPACCSPTTACRSRVVFVLGMLFGACFGLMNGVMVAWARVPSLVITLGTLYVIRGIDFAWAHGRQINAADMPDGFLNLSTHTILGFPILPLFTIAAMVDRRRRARPRPDGPRALRDRLQPGRRGARGHPRERAACSARSSPPARSPASRACCTLAATARWTPTPATASSSPRLRGRGRRRRHLRRLGHASTAPRSARCCWPRSAARS